MTLGAGRYHPNSRGNAKRYLSNSRGNAKRYLSNSVGNAKRYLLNSIGNAKRYLLNSRGNAKRYLSNSRGACHAIFIIPGTHAPAPRPLLEKTHAQNQFPGQACDGHTVQALARRRTICNIRFLGNRNTVAALPTSGHDSQSPPNTQVNSGNRSASLQSKRFHSTRAFCNTMFAAST